MKDKGRNKTLNEHNYVVIKRKKKFKVYIKLQWCESQRESQLLIKCFHTVSFNTYELPNRALSLYGFCVCGQECHLVSEKPDKHASGVSYIFVTE